MIANMFKDVARVRGDEGEDGNDDDTAAEGAGYRCGAGCSN